MALLLELTQKGRRNSHLITTEHRIFGRELSDLADPSVSMENIMWVFYCQGQSRKEASGGDGVLDS